MEYTFDTSAPPTLTIEIQSGQVVVEARQTDQTRVEVTGRSADEVRVDQDGDRIEVIGPRRVGFLTESNRVEVTVSLPTGSSLVTRLGSADVRVTGTLEHTRIATGSGEVTVESVASDAVVKTGSGEIAIETLRGNADLKTGSGSIRVGLVEGQARLATGSGDIEVGRAVREIALKTGSGNLNVHDASDDAVLSTATGDVAVGRFSRGRLKATSASGDISIGVPPDIPVWTDISSATGGIRSNLVGAGRPTEGQEHIRLRARTATGQVVLAQL